MVPVRKIMFPVDFSISSVAMSRYVRRVARLFGATVSVVHVIIPTHAGRFRRMLLGSTAVKVLDDAPCPELTSKHAETIAPRPLLEHREWLFNSTLGLSLRTIQSDTTVSDNRHYFLCSQLCASTWC